MGQVPGYVSEEGKDSTWRVEKEGGKKPVSGCDRANN